MILITLFYSLYFASLFFLITVRFYFCNVNNISTVEKNVLPFVEKLNYYESLVKVR